jgi:hypothetical protein
VGGAPGPAVEEKQVAVRASGGVGVTKRIEEGGMILPVDDGNRGKDKWYAREALNGGRILGRSGGLGRSSRAVPTRG